MIDADLRVLERRASEDATPEVLDALARAQARAGVPVRTPVLVTQHTLPDSSSIELVYVPGGTFLMGSRNDDPQAWDDEKPQHARHLDGYWIGRAWFSQQSGGKP